MKRKIAYLTTISLVACSLTLAQSALADDATATDAAPAAEITDATETVEVVVATEQPATDAADSQLVEMPPQASTVMENGDAESHEEVIPLIQFQDVQLTTAIENLARQAGINYILDPRVGFGQLDERGNVRPQPSISIRWENVTASQALTAVLQNHGLQIVSDPKTKIARVTVKDPAAPDPLLTRIVQLKYASPTNIVRAVQATLVDKRSKVIGDIRTSQLVVMATEKEQDAVEKIVEKLDTITKQVLIEAKLIETSQNPKSIKGIDWSGTLQAQQFAFGNNQQMGPVPDESANPPLATAWPKLMVDTAKGFNPSTAFLNADGVSAVLSFLNESSDAKIIATPRAVTLDNEMADLSVTRAEPIFKVQASTQNTTGGSEVTYTNLGVILQVTPRISANNYVNLKVVPEVSRNVGTARKVVAGSVNEADIYAIRRINTSVMIPSGNTLVLGGLVSDDVRNSNTKVPIFGDIPLLGKAFRQDGKSRDQNNLIIFITPTIVQDSDFQTASNSSAYLQTKPEEAMDQEWTAWDSGKPYDWSKVGSKGSSKQAQDWGY